MKNIAFVNIYIKKLRQIDEYATGVASFVDKLGQIAVISVAKLANMRDRLNTRYVKAWLIRPVAQLPWIATNAHPCAMTWCRSIQQEDLEPSHRADVGSRRRSDGARCGRGTRECWEKSALSHAVAMCG